MPYLSNCHVNGKRRWHSDCSALIADEGAKHVLKESNVEEQEAHAQTMTEYALIMAAIAIVALVAYLTLGTTITNLVNTVIACL